MAMIVVLLVLSALLALWAVSERNTQVKAKEILKKEQEKSIELEKKLDYLREETKKTRDEMDRGRAELKEARELYKKKFKRQIQNEELSSGSEITMTNKALEDSYKAIAAMEIQMDKLKEDQEQEKSTIKLDLEEQSKKIHEEKDDEIKSLKKKIEQSEEQIKKHKRLLRPEGHKIDLSAIPDEAASEFARLYRKAEQHERLHGITNAKLHLAQEKFAELQKRYFSVCRELALLSGQKEDIDQAKARQVAEEMIKEQPMALESEPKEV